jgi:outer membrane immunogenic protein
MKKVLLGGVALITLGFVGAAGAADMPIKAPVMVVSNTWTGFYVGGDVGGVDGIGDNFNFVQGPGPGSPVQFASTSLNSSNHWGAIGGIYGGYNWALSPSWLIGVEGDWSKASLGNTNNNALLVQNTGALPVPGCTFAALSCPGVNMSDNLNWVATVRGRLGYTMGSMMFYGTGGGAWANIEHSGQVFPVGANIGSIATSSSTGSSGWVGGGGIELMATAHWLIRVEYLHYSLSSGTTQTAACTKCLAAANSGPGIFTYNGATFDTVRAGLAYKF